LGWGVENYNTAYNKYFDASFYNLARSQTYFDRAHNIVIELLTTAGVLGLISYLILGFFIYYYLYKYYKREPGETVIISSLAGLFLAYFIQNLLVFDTVVTYIAFFLALSYAYSVSRDSDSEDNQADINLGMAKKFSILIVAILIGYLVVWQNIRPAISAYYMRAAMNENNKPTYYYQDFSNFVRKSLSYNTIWDAEYIIEYTSIFKDFLGEEGVDKQAVSKDVSYIVEVGEKYLPHSHNDDKFISQMSGLYEIIYDYAGDISALERAEELIKMAIDLSPNRIYYWHILAQVYEFDGRDEQAIEALNKARDLNPNVADTYWSLALMYSKLNQPEEIIKNVKEAVEKKLLLYNIKDLFDILPIFEQEQDYETLIFLYRQVVNFEPNNFDYLAKLAGAYAALGQNEEAIETAKKIIEINPAAIEQINQFILDVEAGKYLKISNF